MKKSICILTLNLAIILSVNAQLNPVKNLQWSHWYVMPANCFSLSWTQPDSSLTDTLVGYNIYRNCSLYQFSTSLYHDCVLPCMSGGPGGPFCDFLNFNMGNFYIHVTAVYNQSHLESAYNDSAAFGGIMIGIPQIQKAEPLGFNNVTQTGSSILVELNQAAANCMLTITNVMGQKMFASALEHQKNIEINRSGFSQGIYIVIIRSGNLKISRKFIIS